MGVSVSIERLRGWLLAGAGLLVVVIAVFLGYAHYRAHRFIKDLPGKLGMDITQETNGFTYSQSLQGKTLFTIHAAKAVQRKDGKTTLHDVGIVLYGRKQDRTDRIYGSDFEYDQHAGVIRAMGEVHLDLQAPAPVDAKGKADYAAGKDMHDLGLDSTASSDERLIHIKTSGLVFLRELGVAATEQDIDFEFNGMNGHAKGADYSSDTGVLVLHSAVKVNGIQQGKPVVLTAASAELDRLSNRVTLAQAKYVAVGGGTEGVGQTVQGNRVIVHLRKDRSAERVEADGEVTVTQGEAGKIVAQRADALLSPENRPQSIRFYGGVRFGADQALRKAAGEAGEGLATFDKAGRLEHVVLSGAVHLDDRVRASESASEQWNERELNARTVELALAAEGKGAPQIRDAKASGDAQLRIVSEASKAGRETSKSSLSGDVLTGHFVEVGGTQRLAEAHGAGHTILRRVSGAGIEDVSSGDTIDVQFRHGRSAQGTGAVATKVAKAKATGMHERDEISTAVQQGNVVIIHKPVVKPGDAGAAPEQRATAEKAVYDGGTEKMTLTGGVKVTDAGSTLWADRVAMEQQTGNGSADGSVKASYPQSKEERAATGEIVHVLASRAELKRAADQVIFYGERGRPARLWQGGAQVEAPVIQFEQKQRRLLARGEVQGTPMAVRAVLVTSGSKKRETEKIGPGRLGGGKAGAVRVTSGELNYSDDARKAEFSGGVQVESSDGRMRGQRAVVYLQSAPSGRKAGPIEKNTESARGANVGGFLGGGVEQVVMSGGIEMEQPGRRATGEQLVYKADEGTFVLTGSPSTQPKVVDDARGMVTGASLQFRSGDESVVISNGGNGDVGHRVQTETRVKKY